MTCRAARSQLEVGSRAFPQPCAAVLTGADARPKEFVVLLGPQSPLERTAIVFPGDPRILEDGAFNDEQD